MDDYRKDQSEVWAAEYQEQGLSCRAIGKRHSVPERLVYVTLRELGVDTGARRQELRLDRSAIAKARAAGVSPKQIAAELGTSAAVINNTLCLMKKARKTGDILPATEAGEDDYGTGGEELAERY